MRILLLTAILIGITSTNFSQFGESWFSFWDGKGHYSDRIEDIDTDNNGNTYIVGTSEGSYSSQDIIVIKYDNNGQKLWEKIWDGPVNDEDWGRFIKVNNAGEIIVVGMTENYYGNFNKDIIILKYDALGNLIWESIYQGDNDNDNPTDLEIDQFDNIYIVGDTEEGPNSNRDYTTFKYNTAGTLLWASFYNGTLNSVDYANGVAVSSTGDVYVTGVSRESGGSTIDFTTVKYNANGVEQWANKYNGADNDWDHGKDVMVDPFDNVYATGYCESGGTNNTTTLKYNPINGNLIWEDVQATATSDGGIQIEYSAADTTIVIGGYQSGIYGDFSMIKLDTSGSFQWRSNYSSGNTRDIFSAFTLDSLGNIYAGGRSSIPSSFSEYDVKLLKYNKLGTQEWLYTFDGGFNEVGTIPVAPNNNEVIIGITSNKIGYDENILTIKLDQNGNEVWSTLHEGDAYANDTGSELILDSDFNQIIIGSTNGFQADDLEDYAIVKMDTLGNQLWEYIYKHAEGGKDIAIAATTDNLNNIYVTGHTETLTGGGDKDITTIKLSPNGDLLWTKTYAGAASGDDTPSAIEMDLQGNILVAASGVESSTFDFILLKYDPSGNLLDNHTYNNPTYGLADFAYALAVDSNNNYYITGSTQIAAGSNVDFYIIKTDASGTVIWEDTKGYYGGNSDIARRVLISDSGYIYVAGGTVLLKYDGTGNEIWENNDPNVGSIIDIAVNQNEDIVLTAHKGQSFGTDIVTYEVNNDGLQAWTHSYNHSAGSEDTPYAIASAPNGDVFVVGNQEHQYSTNFQAVMLRFDSLGNLLSNNIYESLANWEDKFTAVEVLPSNRVLLAGQAYEEDENYLPSITWRFNLFAASYADNTPLLKITEVNTVTNEITLKNFGQGTIDISLYKLISDNSQINNLSSMTIVQGALNLSPQDDITLTGMPLEITGEGLALYAPATNFSDPTDLIDFVQWKTVGSSQEAIAVGQGKWTSGTLVQGDAPFKFIGNGANYGFNYWEGFIGTIDAQTLAQCNTICDATATVAATGAYPPYSFLWDANAGNQTSTTATSLCVDNYTVTITDSKGNITEVDVVITPTFELSFNPVTSVESCQTADGEISITPTGGALPYSYSWNDGSSDSTITNLLNGNYNVTVTDANLCSWDTTFTLSQDLGPAIHSLTADSMSCNSTCDGSGAVIATGNGTLSYLWNDANASTTSSVNNLCEGYFSVTITDIADCTVKDSILINAPNSISIIVNTTNDNGQCNGTAASTVAGGTPPYTYLWDDSQNQTLAAISNLCNGSYNIEVTDTNGCTTNEQISIGDASSVEENEKLNYSIHPNPTESILYVAHEYNESITWTITDINGRIILNNQSEMENEFTVNVEELVNGFYFFNVNLNGTYSSRTFIKK